MPQSDFNLKIIEEFRANGGKGMDRAFSVERARNVERR